MVRPASCTPRPSSEVAQSQAVTIDYGKLRDLSTDLSHEIESACGHDGLGLLTVAGVPGYTQCRDKLLALAPKLAALPPEALTKLEDPDSNYSFGWSHGKEELEEGRADTFKGSFYANPLLDRPTDNEAHRKRYPAYCRDNIWPYEIPELEAAFKVIGHLSWTVALLLAERFDTYVVQKNPKAVGGRLRRVIEESKCHKGRLLYYFPPQEEKCSRDGGSRDDVSSWCGWHTDHGSLTALTAAKYWHGFEEVACPDEAAGLYVRARDGNVVKVSIPPADIAFQVGEATQVHSGGLLRATPHCVRAPKAPGVARSTFAMFLQPQWDTPMTAPQNSRPEDIAVGQWQHGQDFGTFTEKTLEKNYKGKKPVEA